MRLIFNLVFRIGIIQSFSIFFIAINTLTFCLYTFYNRAVSKRRIYEVVRLFLTLACGGIGAFFGMFFVREKTKRLVITITIGLIIALIPTIHIFHGLTLGRIIRYVEIDFHHQRWPADLDGYRIAFMTDFHVISHENMARVAAELNRRDIDLLLLGGDFSMWHDHYQGTIREIAEINTTDGIFGVEGNHDTYWRIFAEFCVGK